MATFSTNLNATLLNAWLPIITTYNAGTQLLTFTNTTTDYPFTIYSAGSTCLVSLGFTVADHQSIITGTHCVVS